MTLDRRTLLKLGGVAAAATALPVTAASAANAATPLRAAAAQPRWPGHQPGRIILGAASSEWDRTVADLGQLGAHRTFYQWGLTSREEATIRTDHAEQRMPWVSFKPPAGHSSWDAVAAGQYDADIRRRARFYAGFDKPVIVTFHHEPTDDAPTRGDSYSRAWCRVHDIMADETGLQNVVSVPITTQWIFNPWNRQDDPREWATGPILDRAHFFAVDLYHNASQQGLDERLGVVMDHLDAMGHPELMVGIGEIGATDEFPGYSGADWWREQWLWAKQHTDRLGIISYFNTPHKHDWTLWESETKMLYFQWALKSRVSAIRV